MPYVRSSAATVKRDYNLAFVILGHFLALGPWEQELNQYTERTQDFTIDWTS